ncbi:uncharacterized protein ACRADG_006446 [Cochliomyia hominivorax]
MIIPNPDLVNSCRVCRSPNQDGDYECLYQKTNKREELPQLSEAGILYENLLNISLNNCAIYPQFLCNSCDLQMKLFKKLKDKAYKTWEYLQNIYDVQQDFNVKEINEQETLDILQEFEEEQKQQENASLTNGNLDINETGVYQEYATNEYEVNDGDKEEYNTKEYEATDEYEEKESETYKQDKISIKKPQTLQQQENNNDGNITNIDATPYCDVNSLMEEHFNTSHKLELEPKITELKFHYTTIEVPENDNNSQVTPQIRLDLEPVIDKNDYVTEIYELLEEDGVSDNTMENKEHNMEYELQYADNKTETSSIITDVEYIIEEAIDEENNEDEIRETVGNKLEIENVVKKRKLNNDGRKKRTSTPQMTNSISRKRIYNCEICQVEFNNLQEHKKHRTEVHNEKFPCGICGKELKTLTSLYLHKKIHSEEPEHQCEICQKTFNQKAHYQYHMKLHNNERNFKCTECEKAFITKTDLKIHQRSHTGQRPYVCNICNKDYLMMEHLKAHLLTHTEQEFQCDICKHKFATHKTLRQHVKTIHEDDPRFKCHFCGKPFRRKHHLQYHLKLHQRNVKLLDESFILLPNDNGEEAEVEDPDDLPESDIIVDSGFIALNDDVDVM